MNPRSCVGCARPAQPCSTCGAAAMLHEHVYDEWWCRRCWITFAEPDDSQDAECHQIEGVALDVTPPASGG